MRTKDGRDTPIERLTPENYIVPAGEEKFYHVVIEVRQFDTKTGRRISRPRVQKFGRKSFEGNIRASLQKQGYDLLILHDPNEWLRNNQAKAAESARMKAEAEVKAQQEKFNAAVKATVAEQINAAVQEAVAKALSERENAGTGAGKGEAQQAEETAGKGRKTAK